jgi:dihydrofolate synthase/folylpolyglutamate synthase
MRMLGEYQHRNLALAAAGVRELVGELSEQAVDDAAARVAIPGRFEVRETQGDGPVVVFDGAHNPAGIGELVRVVAAKYPDRRRVAAIAILHDKDIDAMLTVAGTVFDRLVVTQCANPRSEPAAALADRAKALGLDHVLEPDPREALARARDLAGDEGVAVATGSLYLLADLERDPATGRVSQL